MGVYFNVADVKSKEIARKNVANFMSKVPNVFEYQVPIMRGSSVRVGDCVDGGVLIIACK